MSLLGDMGRRSSMKSTFESRVKQQIDNLNVSNLHEAIKSNDVDLVHRCLAQGVGVDDKTGVRETAIFAAIRYNKKDIFELLVRNGADINQRNERDRSCLHEAIRKGRYDMVNIIVHSPGVKLDVASKSGKTSLHLAVITRKRDVVESLLKNGANPNVCCNNGRSPLHWAAINGDKETANLLLTAGANINEKTKHMTTPLIFASHNRGDEIVELLVYREATISGENADGDTALKLVASHGNVKLLTYMLDQMIEQERPNLFRIVLEITKIKDQIDKLDEIGVFRYIYSKICAENSFEEEIGFEIIQILHSPIKFLNWLLKEDKELTESNLSKLLEKRFRSDTQERTILRFLLRLDICIRRCAEKHDVEYKSLMDLVLKVELAINRIFEGDHMDVNLNMWKLLMPSDDHSYTEEDKLLGYARCFQEDNMINFCLSNELKILFDKPHIANIVQKLFRTSLREIVLPEKIESSFNLKSYRIRRSLNLRSCPAANYFLGLVTKTIAIFFTGWISISAYGNNFGTDYRIHGKHITVYGSEIWFIVFLMGQIIHEFGELADSDFSFSAYLQDEWNYFDIVEYLLCFLWLVLRFIPGQFPNCRICLALAAIPQCQGLLRYLSFYKPVGELLIILKAMFSDLSIFLGIYLLMILGFGITFDGLFHRVNNSTFGSITESFLSLFSFTMQNFEFDGIYTTSSPAVNTIGPILQMCFIVMTSIVLLNLLIARMTNSHQRISSQALREWSFSQAKTVSNLLLWKEKNGMSMLPPPFNFISILFAVIDHYHMIKCDEGDSSNAATLDKTYISLAGTVSNAVLTMTVGTFIRFFHRLHRLQKRMRSRTNHLAFGQRLYIFIQILLMVLWFPLYDWLCLLREYEIHLLDRVKENGIIVYDKLPANILNRLENQQQKKSNLPITFQRKLSTRMTAFDGGESVKIPEGESFRKPNSKFSKSVDRINPNKFLRSTSKFYVGRDENESSSYSMGHSLYSIGGSSSKGRGGDSFAAPKEAKRFSLSRLQPFFIADENQKPKRTLLPSENSDKGDDDEDDDDDDSHHGEFKYGGGRENYGVGFRDLFQEKRVEDGEELEYESSSDEEEGDKAKKPSLLPFEQKLMEGKILRKPNLQNSRSSGNVSFFQELEKATFSHNLSAQSNDSGDENEAAYGELKLDDEYNLPTDEGTGAENATAQGRTPFNGRDERAPNSNNSSVADNNHVNTSSNNRVRLSKARVIVSDGVAGGISPRENNEGSAGGRFHKVSSSVNFDNATLATKSPPKKLLRKPFASKIGMMQQSGRSFYQPSVMNMNSASSVFNMNEALPSMMARPAGGMKAPIAATPLTTNSAQRFASQFSVLEHQMWVEDDDKSRIFSPDDIEDILRIFLPSWSDKHKDQLYNRAISRSYSNVHDDDDDKSVDVGRPAKSLRRSYFGGRNSSPQFGDSMRFAFPSTHSLTLEKEKDETHQAINEMKSELKSMKSMFEILYQQQRSNGANVTKPNHYVPPSRSVDGISNMSGGSWSSKSNSPRLNSGNYNISNRPALLPLASSNAQQSNLPPTRSEMMRNMRTDSLSTFGFLPFIQSSDDLHGIPEPTASDGPNSNKHSNLGIGAMNSSGFPIPQSYPSFQILASNLEEDDDLSSSLSHSTDANEPSREPFITPTAIESTVGQQNNPHQINAIQGELRHMKREVRTVMSHMQRMQNDMGQMMQLLSSTSKAMSNTQQLSRAQSRQQLSRSVITTPLSDVNPQSKEQKISTSDITGVNNDSSREEANTNINTSNIANTREEFSSTQPELKITAESSSSIKSTFSVDDFDPYSSFLLHSPSVKMKSPFPSSKFPSVSVKTEKNNDATIKSEEEPLKVDVEENMDDTLSPSELPLTFTISPVGTIVRERAESSENSSVSSSNAGVSLLQDKKHAHRNLQPLSATSNDEAMANVGNEECSDPNNRRVESRAFVEDTFEAQTEETSQQQRLAFSVDNHFWMRTDSYRSFSSEENEAKVEEVDTEASPLDEVPPPLIAAKETNKEGFDYNDEYDDEEEDGGDDDEDAGAFSLSRSLYEFAPTARVPRNAHDHTAGESVSDRNENVSSADLAASAAAAVSAVDSSLVSVARNRLFESRPLPNRQVSAVLQDMYTISRTSSNESS